MNNFAKSIISHNAKSWLLTILACLLQAPAAYGATAIPFTVTTNEAVTITGTPRMAIDVGGTTRYATYTSGTGTSTLTFTYTTTNGDVDLDGVTLTSPIDLNGGTIKDLNGNDATLTYTLPNTSNVKINYPSLSIDFIDNTDGNHDGRYTLNGTVHNTLPAFLSAAGGAFTRASIGTYFDHNGTLQTATSGAPRFDHDPVTHTAKGLLIEEGRTNNVTNSTMQGAAVSTLPTGWGFAQMPPGLNWDVTGTGTENGFSYFDIRFYGTPTNTQQPLLQISDTNITNGQSYATSVYLKNTNNAGNVQINCSGRTAAYAQTGFSATASLVPSGAYTRLEKSFTPADGVTTKILFWLQFTTTNGVYGDQTIRIAAPQFEQGTFSSSFIPTTGTTVSRSSDQLNIATASIPNWSTTTGTWTAEYYRPANPAGTPFIVYSSGGAEPITDRNTSVGTWNGSSELNAGGNPLIRKFASAFDGTGRYLVLNGTQNSGAGTYNIATDNRIYIGGSPGGGRNPFTAISRIKYYPVRLQNTQLQLLTQ